MSRKKLNRFKITPPESKALAAYLITYTSKDLYLQPETLPPISSQQIFGNNHPLILDLGCGRGEFAVDQAQRYPEKNFVGIDTHQKSIFDSVNKAHSAALDNLKFVRANLRWVLNLVPNSSVEVVYLLFPAPVMKKRYRQKDVFTEAFAQQVHRLLMFDGLFHFVTDSEPYFQKKTALVAQLGLFSAQSVEKSLEGGITRYQRFWEGFQEVSHRVAYIKSNAVSVTKRHNNGQNQ